MKAVVMAGGEGTRLRPLTSNQPKPMVPIVGKPCMEHILELLKDHGLEEVIVTLAFLPQAIRGYFGTGESLGMEIEYSVEETPLGTAGSVRLASDRLDDTFLVISGDALCDFDLSALVDFHKQKGAAVTIGLKSVENPLEFGIVVTDEDGRIERFLEKPSWSQVFSDTINTGVYVLEPEVLRHIPDDRPFDFSKELFPLLLEMGRPLYGYVMEGYWQDIGNLDQYRQANFDALDERVRLGIPGIRLRGNIWVGEGVDLADLDEVEAPAFIGNYCRVAPDATVGEYSVLGASVTLREGARTTRSVIDASSHIGRSALVEGAIIGRSCDIRANARLHDGVAIGDEVVIGSESVVMPGVRIYPYKEVESGAHLFESLIWESRATSHLFTRDGVSGLVNVDLTPGDGRTARGGARDVAEARRPRRREPGVGARLPDDQADDALRAQLDRRGRVRSARAALRRRTPPPEDRELRHGLPRRAQPDGPRGRAGALLRAARRPARLRAREGDREELRAPRAAARRRRRRGDGRLPGTRPRDLRAGSLPISRRGRDRGARLSHRRRLRLLRGLVRAPARARAARRGVDLGARVQRWERGRAGPLAGGAARPDAEARRRRRRRPRSRLRPGGRAALPRRRERARRSARADASAHPHPAGRGREDGQDRRAGDGHPPRRPDGRGGGIPRR